MNNKIKSMQKSCRFLSNKFLELATEFKALEKSLERETDKKVIQDIQTFLMKRKNKLIELFGDD